MAECRVPKCCQAAIWTDVSCDEGFRASTSVAAAVMRWRRGQILSWSTKPHDIGFATARLELEDVIDKIEIDLKTPASRSEWIDIFCWTIARTSDLAILPA